MSATAQRDELWAQIEATAYPLDNTLPVSDPNAITGLGLLIPPFLWQTFFHKGSTMPIGKAMSDNPCGMYLLVITCCPDGSCHPWKVLCNRAMSHIPCGM